MKTTHISYVLFLLFIIACNPKKQNENVERVAPIKKMVADNQNALIANEVIVVRDIPIETGVAHKNFGEVLQIEQLAQNSLSDIILDQVLDNKILVYDNLPNSYGVYLPPYPKKKITVQEIEKKFGVRNDSVFVVDAETKENEMVDVSVKLNRLEFKSILFTEKWNFDTALFIFQKNVVAMEPIRHYYSIYDTAQNLIRLKKLFRIIYDQNKTSKTDDTYKPLLNIVYEVKLENELDYTSDIYFNQKLFLWQILKIVYDKQVDIYKWQKNEKLNIDEIGINIDYLFEKTHSVWFIEYWTIDYNTLHIKKEVKGIAPILHDYNNLDKYTPFVVYTGKNKPT